MLAPGTRKRRSAFDAWQQRPLCLRSNRRPVRAAFCYALLAGGDRAAVSKCVARSRGAAMETVAGKKATIHFDGQRCIHSRHCVLERPDVFVPNVKGE
ncbi:MAG: (4Fe-4S)-binding protein, partial [bacterium]